MLQLTNRQYMAEAVMYAVKAGFRHFDTAPLYLTKDVMGQGLKQVLQKGIVKREELFITTKVNYRKRVRALQSSFNPQRRAPLFYNRLCLMP